MRKGGISRSPLIFVFTIATICFMFLIFVSVVKLPDGRVGKSEIVSLVPMKIKAVSKNEKIGKFGKMIIEMLPKHLGFTVFLPTEKAFERDLKLHWNDSLVVDENDDTYAILTRILGFAAVPRMIYWDDVNMYDREINYDSLSGFILYIYKDRSHGALAVNNRIRSEQVDLNDGKKIVVHLMDGVLMDAEFEQTIL